MGHEVYANYLQTALDDLLIDIDDRVSRYNMLVDAIEDAAIQANVVVGMKNTDEPLDRLLEIVRQLGQR